MLTDDVRVDTSLNKFVWSNGIRNLPTRVNIIFLKKLIFLGQSKTFKKEG